jgi:hypothetical protein
VSSTPIPPSGLILVDFSTKSINIKWTDNSDNETDFLIEYSETDNLHFETFETVPANRNGYNVSSSGGYFKDSTTYFFRVKAKNIDGASSPSNEISFTTKGANPGNLTVTGDGINRMKVQFNINSKIESGIIIERSTNDANHFVEIQKWGGITDETIVYLDTTVIKNVNYYYRVATIIRNVRKYSGIVASTTCESGVLEEANFITEYFGSSTIYFYKDTFRAIGRSGTFYSYDRKNSRWITKALSPLGERANFTIIPYNNLVSVCYGIKDYKYPINFNYQYDIEQDKWTRKSDAPYPVRIDASTFTINNKVYFLGGTKVTTVGSGYSYVGNMSECWEYDNVNDTWTQLDTFPVDKSAKYIVTSVGDKAYLFLNSKDVWTFSPTTKKWTYLKLLKNLVNCNKGCYYNGKFYFVATDATIVEYDLENDIIIRRIKLPENISIEGIMLQPGKDCIWVGNLWYTSNYLFYPDAPSAPYALKAKIIEKSKVKIVWKDNTDLETNYIVERFNSFGIGTNAIPNYSATLPANSTSFVDSGIVKGEYAYRISAINANGQRASSDLYVPCKEPSFEIAYAMTNYKSDSVELYLTFASYATIDKFIIERQDSAGGKYVKIDSVFDRRTVYTDRKLVIGNIYTYNIKAYNSFGMTSKSVKVIPGSLYMKESGSIKILDTKLFDLNGWNSQIPYKLNNVTLSLLPDSAGKKIYVDFFEYFVDGDTMFIYDGSTIKSPLIGAFTKSNLPKTIYSNNNEGSLTLSVKSGDGRSSNSYGWYARAKSEYVYPPTNLIQADTANNKVKLKWKDNSNDETGFIIERSKSEKEAFAIIKTVSANTTEYVDTTLNNKRYYYRIRAIKGNQISDCSLAIRSNVTPLPPQNLRLRLIDESSITIQWDDMSNCEDKYTIESSNDSVHFIVEGDQKTDSVIYKFTKVYATSKYYFRVKAANAIGDSKYSNIFGVKLSLYAPTKLEIVSQSESSLTLQWVNNSIKATEFVVEQSVNDTLNFVSTNNNASKSPIIVYSRGLSLKDKYYYRVRAKNYYSTSAPSNIVGIFFTPNKPSIPWVAAVYDDEVRISWFDYSNIEKSYIIERSVGDSLNFKPYDSIPSDNLSKLVYSYLDLKSQTVYFRVKAKSDFSYSDYSPILAYTGKTLMLQKAINDQYSIYPNPSNGVFLFKMNNTDVSEVVVNILNEIGQNIKTIQTNSAEKILIDLSQQQAGMYYLQIKFHGRLFNEKLVILK